MSAETAAILDEAANVIRRNGLHKGSFYDKGSSAPNWSCCTYGAINIASGGNSPQATNDAGKLAYAALTKFLGLSDGIGDCIADWSDHPDRTAEQVIAALEAAARAEREATS